MLSWVNQAQLKQPWSFYSVVYRIEPSAHQYLCTCWVAVVVQHHLGTYFFIHPIHVHTLLAQMHSLH